MSSDLTTLVGRSSEEREFVWDDRLVRLYSLAVGAASDDPTGPELVFAAPGDASSNAMLPSFAVLPGADARRSLDLHELGESTPVHAGQSIRILQPLRREGRLVSTARISAVWDKGSGALVEIESVSRDAVTDKVVVVNNSATFAPGAGGFGGERGPSVPAAHVEVDADAVVSLDTRPEQALLYALLGDENPLHWNPEVAAAAGFERPILHGLCTFAIALRAVVSALDITDPSLLRDTSARFSAPVIPGERLSVSVWRTPYGARFRATKADGTVVLDRGVASLGTSTGAKP
ncbi:MaoC/PaaZ C-terminal domain-containing protein [Gryllotalpicola protaetiae]|uniref:Enoyl-CoA hydratase n=1 Tax=Gryllotalpicola protaetiae TaxID=2419771 RepID=A0A387BM93_9MICO|nr:MaoC/PaaZ C-terminal domain-containing protein [Gryllotalpicola protaetiae]AYG03154.1 enoyl-CoA hydratase [Gryllotalpicola protaetiae]